MATAREGSPFVSHGRGGAANLTRDDTPYADGGIVREGAPDNIGSKGRGGVGNIGSPQDSPRVGPSEAGKVNAACGVNSATTSTSNANGHAPAYHAPVDTEYVPELNMKTAPTTFHVGRGGEGNAQHNGMDSVNSREESAVHHHEGAAQRFKEMLLGKEGKP